MWREHAVETASVLNSIDPDFIRVRTLKLLKSMPLYRKMEEGDFVLMSDDEIVVEERLLIESLNGIHSTFKSDHVLNLLEEVEGQFPNDKGKMLAVIDRYLSLRDEERANFRLGRRAGAYRSLDDLSNPDLHGQVEQAMRRIESETPGGLDQVISQIMESFI